MEGTTDGVFTYQNYAGFGEFERLDDDKAEANYAKHCIPFELAVRVFDDPFRFEIEDGRFDYGEERIITLGLIDGRVYVVIYTPRDDRCRIISARKANARESRRYHDLQT